jgi:poly(3-hydroxybutyrate) depolymerase
MATRGELTPLSMTMMGGPIDARKSPTAVNNLAMTKSHSWFEKNVIYRVPSNFPGAGRRVYPGFLQYAGFVAMNPSNHARSHYDYFKDLIKGDGASTEAHRKFYDEYNAVLDMDANYYLQTIKVVFQDFSLVNGTWDIRNPQGQLERVRPQDIKTTALFSVEGELDDISGSGQTEAVHAICSGVVDSEQRHLIVEGAGHYGIFSGRRWREVVYPEVKKFILAHQPSPAPTATQSSESSPSITPTRPAATKKAAKKPAAAKPAAAAKPVGTVAEASLAAPTPTRSTAVTRKKAVPAKRTSATASGKTAPRTARSK